MRSYLSALTLILTVLLLAGCGEKGPAGTWTPSDTGKPDEAFFELNFLSPEVGYVTGWDEKGPKETAGWEIFQTRDGGKSWNVLAKQIEEKIQFVTFINDKTGWALNVDHDILYTTDGGETWAVQRKAGKSKIKYNYNNPGAPTEMPDPLARIKFLNDKLGWAWGGGKKDDNVEQEGVFLITTDGGQNWQKFDYTFSDELKALFFLNDKLGWASDRKGGLYKTTNSGRSWLKQPDDTRRPSINGIFFINETKGWLVGPDGYIGSTEDGGQNWVKKKIGKNFFNDIHFVSDKVGWVVGENGVIMRTEDGGQNWQKQESGTDYTLTRVQFLNNKSGWAAGNGVLLRYEGIR